MASRIHSAREIVDCVHFNVPVARYAEEMMAAFAQRARSQRDISRLHNLKSCFHLLSHGRAMTQYEQLPDLLRELRVPGLPSSSWSDTSGWKIAEALFGNCAS
jgi:hypothetical protein